MLAFAGAGFVAPAVAQEEESSSAEPVLVDEFGLVGDCDFGGRIDSFLAELSQKPAAQGYVIDYKSAGELPGDRDSFDRELRITNHISYRNFDSSRITIVRGGYRPDVRTELWAVPPGAKPPEPSGTVPEPPIPEGETLLFTARHLELYAYEATPNEFVLASYLEKESARYAELNAPEEETESGETGGEDSIAITEVEEEEESEVTDERTEEQKEEDRFQWANVGLAKHAATRKGSGGVIIFYADDQQYDIGKLTSFIERGRDLLVTHGEIDRGRITVVFGGYRDTPEVEFWFVPKNGKGPVPTPAERPVEQPDATEN